MSPLGVRVIIKHGEIRYVDTPLFPWGQISAIESPNSEQTGTSHIELRYSYTSHIHVDGNVQNVHLTKKLVRCLNLL